MQSHIPILWKLLGSEMAKSSRYIVPTSAFQMVIFHISWLGYNLKCNPGARGMAWQLIMLTALPEDWSSVPSSHAGQSSRGPDTLFRTLQGT